jgi:tetratricopeptide (TPR) repeat protein
MAVSNKSPTLWHKVLAFLHLWSGRVHRHYGIVYTDREEFISAVESYARAVQLDPGLAVAYLERGILLWRELGRAGHAVRDLSTALKLRPAWPEALFNRGQAYQSAGNYRAALSDLAGYLDLGHAAWQENAEVQVEHLRAILEAQSYDSREAHGS